MKEIIEAMGRAMYVCNWADHEEEKGRCYCGEDLMDVAPKTPRKAINAAYRLTGYFEALNQTPLISLFVRAMVTDGIMQKNWKSEELKEYVNKYGKDFGHCLAMKALGHGVAWEDDHKPCGIIYPNFEYYD